MYKYIQYITGYIDGYKYYTVTADYGTLEIYVMDNNLANPFPLYDYYFYESNYLNNYMGSYRPNRTSNSFQPFTSKTGTITVFYSITQLFLINTITQLVFRIKENFTENCNEASDIIYVDGSVTKHLTTLQTGTCYLSILLPTYYNDPATTNYALDKIPSLSINSINYKGNSSVTISNNLYSERILFEISETNANYWENVVVYGKLLSYAL